MGRSGRRPDGFSFFTAVRGTIVRRTQARLAGPQNAGPLFELRRAVRGAEVGRLAYRALRFGASFGRIAARPRCRSLDSLRSLGMTVCGNQALSSRAERAARSRGICSSGPATATVRACMHGRPSTHCGGPSANLPPSYCVYLRTAVEAKTSSSKKPPIIRRARGLGRGTKYDGTPYGSKAVQLTPRAASSIFAISIFFIASIACIARCARAGSLSPSRRGSAVGMICHDRPNLSFSHPH